VIFPCTALAFLRARFARLQFILRLLAEVSRFANARRQSESAFGLLAALIRCLSRRADLRR